MVKGIQIVQNKCQTSVKHHFSNYGPVTLLPKFLKILEKLFINRLDKYKLLSDSQYGVKK